MSSLVFPDLNVWLALTLKRHQHFAAAWRWYRALPDGCELVFCRQTQLGLLRLLSTEQVAGSEIRTQQEAWLTYDLWIDGGGARFAEEPFGLELEFRSMARQGQVAVKDWTDSYLLAFASSQSMELVTFDKGLHRRYARCTLLVG